MQEPLAEIGEEPDDLFVVSRHEDTGVAPLGPDLFLGNEFDLHALPRPLGLAVGLLD